MADIAFLLIIFFMLTTTFIKDSGLDIRLPGARSADELPPAREVYVSIGRSGTILVDTQPVALEQLSSVLQQKLKATTDKTVTVRADRQVEYGLVVTVIDIAKSLGARINLAVEKLPPEAEPIAVTDARPAEVGSQ